MSRVLSLALGMLLFWLFVGCQRNNWLLGDEFQQSVILKIMAVDSITYSNYYNLSFRSKSGEPGRILIDKKDGLLPIWLYPGIGFQQLMLGDIIEFRSDGIALRGHGTESGFYIDGVRHIDLSPSAKRPYYRIISTGR